MRSLTKLSDYNVNLSTLMRCWEYKSLMERGAKRFRCAESINLIFQPYDSFIFLCIVEVTDDGVR